MTFFPLNNLERREGMKRSIKVTLFLTLAAAITTFVVSPVLAQEKPADNMQILADKIKADKKLLVAANLNLTESEAKGFWPVYEEYQKDLAAINQRIARLIESYAKDYETNTLTDEKARKLTAEFVAIQKKDGGLQASYVRKLDKVLPPKKVAIYLQIENKIRAVVKYTLATNVPVIE
jgi:DNA repair photolyase